MRQLKPLLKTSEMVTVLDCAILIVTCVKIVGVLPTDKSDIDIAKTLAQGIGTYH